MIKKSNLKIDFINFVENPFEESISYPMGILYIASNLKKQGFTNIGLIDHICLLRKLTEKEEKRRLHQGKQEIKAYHDSLDEKLLKYLKERKPHLILLGPITSLYLVELIDLLPKLREILNDRIAIAGGPHFGLNLDIDEELLQFHPDLDALTIGESEETITEVVELYYSKSRESGRWLSRLDFLKIMKEIPGIMALGKQLKPRNYLHLDDLSPPDMDLLEDYWKSDHVTWDYEYRLSKRRNPSTTFRGYFEGESDWGAIEDEVAVFPLASNFRTHFPFGVIMGSRGCPFHCSFCSSQGARRTHSARYLFDRVSEMNEKYGISTFAFFDSLFTTASRSEQERVKELCNMIIETKLDIKYLIEIRTDVILALSKDILALMIRSGCSQVNLGLEKGSDESLKRIMKESNIKQHFEAIEKLREVAKNEKKEVLINGTFILGGPEETIADVLDTILYCWSLNLDEHTFYVMDVYPGTKIYDDALKDGILETGLSPYLRLDSFPQYGTKELPIEYLNRICDQDEQALMYLREFKQAMFEIENQFLPEYERVVRFVVHVETRKLLESVNRFFEKTTDYTKLHKHDVLSHRSDIGIFLDKETKKVENEIRLVEKRLLKRFSNYKPEYGDYHPGTLKQSWEYFLRSFEKLLYL